MPDIDAKKIEELLPCPFCGGAAQAEHFESKLGRWRWSIGCNDHTSKADDGGEPAAECYGFQSMTSFATKAEAIAAWNRRASHSLASASGGEDAGDPQSIADARQIASEGEYTTDGGRSFAVEFDWVGIAQQGFENWKAKPHNARWFRKIDGTPIPNDLTICIGEAFSARIRSLSARLAEARREMDAYRDAFGCLSCGEDHPVESMCPPHEVRSSGMGSYYQQIGKAVARATAAESEAAALRERVDKQSIELAEREAIIQGFLRCPRDLDQDTRALERRARTALEGRE